MFSRKVEVLKDRASFHMDWLICYATLSMQNVAMVTSWATIQQQDICMSGP
jgi:hypothetical protein